MTVHILTTSRIDRVPNSFATDSKTGCKLSHKGSVSIHKNKPLEGSQLTLTSITTRVDAPCLSRPLVLPPNYPKLSFRTLLALVLAERRDTICGVDYYIDPLGSGCLVPSIMMYSFQEKKFGATTLLDIIHVMGDFPNPVNIFFMELLIT